jgi:hypothetical protein
MKLNTTWKQTAQYIKFIAITGLHYPVSKYDLKVISQLQELLSNPILEL